MDYETSLYLSDCVDEVLLRGETKFDADNVDYLIRAVNQITWKDVERSLPEAMPKYQGRLSIPCVVAVAPPVCRPNQKLRVTIARRQWNQWRERWEWSRGLKVILWREVPEV